MNIYRISQTVNNNYDTYDSAIVYANSASQARRINPSPFDRITLPDSAWAEPSHVEVEYIGRAKPGVKAGVILASFNAG